MGTFFVDLAVSAKHVAYSLLSDALGLSTRPLALFSFCYPKAQAMLEIMTDGELLPGLVASVSIVLLVISCAQVLDDIAIDLFIRMAAAIYTADGIAQLPKLVAPHGSWIEGWLPTGFIDTMTGYPESRTGIFVTTFQLRFCPLMVLKVNRLFCGGSTDARMWLVIAALPLRYMSMMVVTIGGPASCFMFIISTVLLVLAITPVSFWELMGKWCKKACECAEYVCSLAYNLIVRLWPKIKACIWAVIVNRFTRFVYDLCQPCWDRFHTCLMPLAMSAVAYSCVEDVHMIISTHVLSIDHVVLVLGKAFCGASAAVSTIILGWHGVSRVCRRRQPDPLKHAGFLGLLKISSFVISIPWRVVRAIAEKLFEYIIEPILRCVADCAERLARFASDFPVCTILLVLLVNVAVIMKFAKAERLAEQFFSVVRTLAASALGLQTAVGNGTITDSGLAIVLIAVVQIGAFSMVASILSSVRVLRNERTAETLGFEELNNLAAGMRDPRQCARCGFGPVDYTGCSDLQAHHMEFGVRGGTQSRVSNACPRCGWFTGSIHNWPSWDGHLQTESGRAMFRQRVWCEVVVGVRAVAKALLFPYGILQFGNFLRVPPSLSAFLAFSYVIPWVQQNATVLSLLNNGSDYGTTRRRQRGPLPQGAQTEVGSNGDHGPGCGAAATESLLPGITESEALVNILSNTPTRIWVQEGDICSVCLEPFLLEVASVAKSGEPIGDICQELRRLDPPVVVTRCGHALHVQCAEAAVAAAGDHHVRCPLCRQPVTLQGEAAAVMFS